jgi:hypothetical protein
MVFASRASVVERNALRCAHILRALDYFHLVSALRRTWLALLRAVAWTSNVIAGSHHAASSPTR